MLPKRNGPRYESIIVKTSFLAFMVYFCALREENDLDDFLRDNVVWDPVGECNTLQQRFDKERAEGLDTSETEQRLRKMEALVSGDHEVLNQRLREIEQARAAK